MKKTILALTIPALFATSASAVTVYSDEGAQVDIYGRVQFDGGELDHQNDSNGKEVKSESFGTDGSARLGVNMSYALNNDVDLIGKLEWQVAAEASDDSKFDARYAWAGFRFMDTTELTFGRSVDPLAQAIYLTDVFNIFGAGITYGSEFSISDKADDQIMATYAANGVDLRAAYAFADDDRTDFANQANGDVAENQWAVSAGYTFPFGLGLVAAYEQQNGYEKTGLTSQNIDQDVWYAGVHYTLDGFYFAALYSDRQRDTGTAAGDDEGTAYELHAQYNVDAWTLMAQYSKEEFDAAGATEEYDSIDDITLGVQYDLTSKTKLYAEYVISDSEVDTSGAKKDDLYGVGIQYNF
ncbi:outer membrane porin II (OmpK40) [Oceanimonas sp. GK1]|uniref:porin n=1 Tax=Oceanimonas sp. (strain GK1 / IBRC-M 10197) TaxID=511062 RepID=UPI00024955C8|nr:porin [Oceanimonas sp. GK1]AEY02066.1 outer membrane porin II (OmpK40) [Oceanimonas sp. GK1]